MAKTTIYLNKEAEEIYRVAKEYAGDNLSAVIVQSLKLYVDKMDMMTKGMEEVVIFEGTNYLKDEFSQGKNLKFIGLLLAKCATNSDYEDFIGIGNYWLYLTRKGKFLIRWNCFNIEETMMKCGYKTYDTFLDISPDLYPTKLLKEARDKMPEIAYEELDV